MPSTRERILRAAADLLAEGGREAVSTRGVSAAAGVQPPTIYRQFGDMQGLLDAVAREGFSAYLGAKVARVRAEDPVDDLRRGWDLHVGFGLAHPALYALMYGDPRPGVQSAVAAEAHAVLWGLIQRVAEAGRLRVGVDDAAMLVQAGGVGVVLALIATPDTRRDLALSDRTREAIIAAIATDPADGVEDAHAGERRLVQRAVALKAVLPGALAGFTAAESGLLREWLGRLSRPSR